ncbi:hypothetical protein BEH94_10290 [Candidatus Altiarchaeales archaeon WOR_SM1_SCG]|nr:hypothetical protein BEH94_10290 [Candidatus Altiarchaeales archaeon WOR_SM1_SCG]ODS39369.1 MAG: hypothetical protein A7315_11205 [Candidatus Altiarchaeales archaeon WOR_SM1_79]
MIDTIYYIVIYIIAGMGLLSLIWIYQGIKNLTEGLIRTLFMHVFAIAGYAFSYAVWTFCVSVGIIELDVELYRILNGVFIAIFFMIITRTAVYAKRIGIAYGFKKDD